MIEENTGFNDLILSFLESEYEIEIDQELIELIFALSEETNEVLEKTKDVTKAIN